MLTVETQHIIAIRGHLDQFQAKEKKGFYLDFIQVYKDHKGKLEHDYYVGCTSVAPAAASISHSHESQVLKFTMVLNQRGQIYYCLSTIA